jgi:hypothetical protein
MPLILIGVIGGMLVDGLLGLFVGPVLLAVSYVLLLEWLRQHPIDRRPQVAGPATFKVTNAEERSPSSDGPPTLARSFDQTHATVPRKRGES